MQIKIDEGKHMRFRFIAVPAIGILVALVAVVIISAMSIIKTAEQFAKMQGVPVVEKVFNYIDGDKFEKLASTLDKNDKWAEKTRLCILS